jgi:hypothetical protein
MKSEIIEKFTLICEKEKMVRLYLIFAKDTVHPKKVTIRGENRYSQKGDGGIVRSLQETS